MYVRLCNYFISFTALSFCNMPMCACVCIYLRVIPPYCIKLPDGLLHCATQPDCPSPMYSIISLSNKS